MTRSLDDRSLRLSGSRSFPDGFLSGFQISALGDGAEVEITGHDAKSGTVTLAEDIGTGLRAGSAVELRSGEEAPLLAARLITGTTLSGKLPPVALRLATTRGTNALLERRGAPTAHFITAGFEDLLHIGDQHRPDLFALHIQRPLPLPEDGGRCSGAPRGRRQRDRGPRPDGSEKSDRRGGCRRNSAVRASLSSTGIETPLTKRSSKECSPRRGSSTPPGRAP